MSIIWTLGRMRTNPQQERTIEAAFQFRRGHFSTHFSDEPEDFHFSVVIQQNNVFLPYF